MKAKHCAECKHFAYYVGPLCAKGYKPRFYVPQTHHQAMLGLYGYKRRCEDFEGAPGANGGDGTAPGSPPD